MMYSDQESAEASNPYGPGTCTVHNRELVKDPRYECNRSSHSAFCTCKDKYDCPQCNPELAEILETNATRNCRDCQCKSCHGEGFKPGESFSLARCPTCDGSGIAAIKQHANHGAF